jgi:hypothetical protein
MGTAPLRQWSGEAMLRPGLLAFTGRIGPASLHAHHTVGVNVALSGTVMLADADGRAVAGRAFIVPADVAHQIVRGAEAGIMAQVEPTSRAGRVLTSMVTDPDAADAWAQAGALLAPPYPWDVETTSSVATSHPAVARAVRLLVERASAGPVRLSDVGGEVGLVDGTADIDDLGERRRVPAPDDIRTDSRRGSRISDCVPDHRAERRA